MILGSGIGGLNEIETQVERLLHKGPDKVSVFTIPKLIVNAASGHVSIRFGLRGTNTAIATACARATVMPWATPFAPFNTTTPT